MDSTNPMITLLISLFLLSRFLPQNFNELINLCYFYLITFTKNIVPILLTLTLLECNHTSRQLGCAFIIPEPLLEIYISSIKKRYFDNREMSSYRILVILQKPSRRSTSQNQCSKCKLSFECVHEEKLQNGMVPLNMLRFLGNRICLRVC